MVRKNLVSQYAVVCDLLSKGTFHDNVLSVSGEAVIVGRLSQYACVDAAIVTPVFHFFFRSLL